MRQLSLLPENHTALAGVLPAMRAAMRRAAGEPDGEGRKLLVDRLNVIARREEVRLTGGNARSVSKDVLDKWLSPSDQSRPPSILAVLAFCEATGDVAPLRIALRAVGLDVMTAEDRRYRDIGLADAELKAARKRKRQLEESL